MRDKQPLVTVNILSFNRRDELRNTLTKVFEQNYKNIEVIVVDNASSDGSTDLVESEFPSVKLIKLEKNIGIAGWNEGFKIAKGEYILVLDDDSHPDKRAIDIAIECIAKSDNIGVFCLIVYNKAEERYETEYLDKNKPKTFIGCGAVIRKGMLHEIGYFSELLFLYEHETEFSMRVYNAGYDIKFCDKALIIHDSSFKNREIRNKSDHRRKFYLCRNYLIILFLHFNFFRIMIFLPQLILARLAISIIEKNFFTTLRGFSNAIIQLPKVMGERVLLRGDVQKFYKYGNYMGRFVKDKSY